MLPTAMTEVNCVIQSTSTEEAVGVGGGGGREGGRERGKEGCVRIRLEG